MSGERAKEKSSEEGPPGINPPVLREFFTENEHLFVIAGVFGALAIYMARFKDPLTHINEGYLNLGVFCSLFLFLLTTLLIFYYAAEAFDVINPAQFSDRALSLSREGFAVTFFFFLFIIVITVGAALLSLRDALFYVIATLGTLLLLLLFMKILIETVRRWFKDRSPMWKASFVTLYLLIITAVSFYVVGLFAVRYNADPSAIAQFEPHPELLDNIIAVAMLISMLLALMHTSFSLMAVSFLLILTAYEAVSKSITMVDKLITSITESRTDRRPDHGDSEER